MYHADSIDNTYYQIDDKNIQQDVAKTNHHLDDDYDDPFSDYVSENNKTLQQVDSENYQQDDKIKQQQAECIECTSKDQAEYPTQQNKDEDLNQKTTHLTSQHNEKNIEQNVSKTDPDANATVNKNNEMSPEEYWETMLPKGTVPILYALSKSGLPESAVLRRRIFDRFKNYRVGDYPVTYEHLKRFYPKLLEYYPEEKTKEKIGMVTASGNYKKEIENSQSLTIDEKGLLLFILP